MFKAKVKLDRAGQKARRERAMKMLSSGDDLADISKAVGLTESYIRVLASQNRKTIPRRTPMMGSRVIRAVAMLQRGATDNTIARKLNVTREYIGQVRSMCVCEGVTPIGESIPMEVTIKI